MTYQAHLVSENSIDTILLETNHPVEAFELIVSHFSKAKRGRLRRQTRGIVLVCLFHFDFLIFVTRLSAVQAGSDAGLFLVCLDSKLGLVLLDGTKMGKNIGLFQ